MPASRRPVDGGLYFFPGGPMPCPDNYYYKRGQAEVEFWDKTQGNLGFAEYIVLWKRIEFQYVQAAIEEFNNTVNNQWTGTYKTFPLLSPKDFFWHDCTGIMLEPEFEDVDGGYILNFRLHFTHLFGKDVYVTNGLAPSSNSTFNYTGGSLVPDWNF